MGGSAPKPPDMAAAAEAEAAGDLQAARTATYANRVDQTNPWGSIGYESYQDIDPASGEPVTRWRQSTTLTPEAQAALDAQMGLSQGRSELAGGMMEDLQQDYGQRMDFDQYGDPIGMDPMQRMGGAGEGISSGGGMSGGNLSGLPAYERQNLEQQIDWTDPGLEGQNLEKNLDYTGAPDVNAPEWTREAAERSVYDRGASRLDPQIAQESEALDVRLRSQGLNPGDEAYDAQMNNFERRKTDAYDALQAQSMQEGARQAESMFGMESKYRDQSTGEEDRMKDFRNSALLSQYGIDSDMQQQLFDIAESEGMFTNKARATQMAADLAARLGEGQLQMGQQSLANQAAMGNWQMQNQAQQQGWNQQQQQLGYNQNLGFRENALANQLRSQGMNEDMGQRAYRLNEVNSLISGQQVQAPQFNSYSQQGQTQGPAYLGAADMQYQGDMAKYGADQAMWNSLMSGAGMGASMMMGSDRRLKNRVVKIAEINGTNWYEFDYVWGGSAIGVMADEVPWATVETPSGYLMVDYRRV